MLHSQICKIDTKSLLFHFFFVSPVISIINWRFGQAADAKMSAQIDLWLN